MGVIKLSELVKESKQYWLSVVPDKDDFGDKISDEIIDAETTHGGAWALMTPKSWKIHGKGKLGSNHGQRFKLQKGNPKKLKYGTWKKVEG